MEEFRYRFKKYRRAAGLRQRDIAAALNVDVSTIAQWESGRIKRPSGPMLMAAARQLGVEPGALWTEDDDQRLPSSAKTSQRDEARTVADLALDRTHWLYHFMNHHKIKTDEDKISTAQRMEKKLGGPENINPLVAETWLAGNVSGRRR